MFNAEMLILGREFRGYSQNELSERVGIAQGTISKMEAGYIDGMEYLEKISNVLELPMNFFTRPGRRFDENLHFFRKRIQVPKKQLMRSKALVSIIRLNMEKLLLSVDIPDENLPKWDVSELGSPLRYAQYIREYWRLPKGRIEDLTSVIEANGILVLHLDFGSTKFDGLSFFTDGGHPVIILNKAHSGDRLRLTLAHELGHIGMHFSQPIDMDRDVENEAFTFAAELLMPSFEIKPYLTKITMSRLADLKRYWKVSMASILFKAKTLNLIGGNSYRYLWTQFRTLGYHIQEPPEIAVPVEKPSLISEIINVHLQDLDYTKNELTDLLSLSVKDFDGLYLPQHQLRVIQK